MRLAVFLISSCLILSVHAVVDTSVCDLGLNTGSGKPFPTIPDIFSANIQLNLINNKTTMNIRELFDSVDKKAVMYNTVATGDYKNISLTEKTLFDYNSNELLNVITLAGVSQCAGEPLDQSDNRFLFGESTTGFDAKTAFRINDALPPNYMGSETADEGTILDHWQSCVYMKSIDATLLVDWYFTSSDQWTSALGVKSVPVRIQVKGKAHARGPDREVNNVYRISNFLDFIPDHQMQHFQVPSATICPFLKDYTPGKPMPKISPKGYFSYFAEVVEQDNFITSLRERVDPTLGVSRYDYRPQPIGKFSSPYGSNPVSEYHDFRTGVAYTIDRDLQNCSISQITPNAFDAVNVDPTHVRMKTTAEFFGLTGVTINYTYTGPQTIRDIQADTYVAQRVDWGGKGLKSIWEISFASDDYVQASGGAEGFGINEPIRMRIQALDADYSIVYNVIDFSEEEPDILHFDISPCFSNSEKKLVTMLFPGEHKDFVFGNPKQFKYFLLVSIIGYLDIQPLRISQIEFDLNDDGNILVQFHLLNPPPITGNVPGAEKLVLLSTDQAFNVLKKIVDLGDFVVLSSDPTITNVAPIVAIPNSVLKKDVVVKTETNTVVKLDSGAAAGIAIGLFIVGAVIGVLIIFIINKVRGGATPPNLTMSFSPKTFQNEQ